MDAARRDDRGSMGVVLSISCHGADGVFLGCATGMITELQAVAAYRR